MQSLSDLLLRELADVRRFCALLDEERKVLTGAQADRLPDIAAAKSSLAEQLSQFEIQRSAVLTRDGFPSGRAGVEAWLASRPHAVAERSHWSQLKELAVQARNENETNGQLINLLLKQNQEALSALLAGGGESIYGSDGQPTTVAGGKRSFGAA